MHASSLARMREFVELLNPATELAILDVGSCDVNGSYRQCFDKPAWTYHGLDLAPGENVDIVARGPYDWNLDRAYDVVVSGQCLEHVEDVKEWAMALKAAVRPDGAVCVIAPWVCNFHRYPVDCWRIMPDGMTWLLNSVVGFRVRQSFLEGTEIGDCVGVAHGDPVRQDLLAGEVPTRMATPGKFVCSVRRV